MADHPTIQRLFIANRSEIVTRVATTARRLGIATVGMFAPDDRRGAHLRSVDEAVEVPGGYLDVAGVVAAAVRCGCHAVHPGYGFLAERADFAQAVLDAGLVWVGPSPAAMAALGDKVAARELAESLGVPVSPRFDSVPDADAFPVIVKAAAGGGGRGMRIVRSAQEWDSALAAAAVEAEASFGDGTVFVERYFERARHVEVQAIGDASGTVVVLGDRDCSVQRRHQKVIEEAPAPGLGTDVRLQLHESSVRLLQDVRYEGAATVEFLVDGTDVAFLEVNTRLQVEHPVTEAVFGVDLVEWQLLVASGGPLAVRQSDLRPQGHAIEARVVAENPADGWVPSVGRLTAFSVGDDTVRVDTAMQVGDEVSPSYDSMIAKVIAHGPDRESARRCLAAALRRSSVAGVATDLDALMSIIDSSEFVDAIHTTALLRDRPELETGRSMSDADLHALVVAAIGVDTASHGSPWPFATPGWRLIPVQGTRSRWRTPSGMIETEHRWEDATRCVVRFGAPPTPDETGALGDDERVRVDAVVDIDGGVVAVTIDGVMRRVGVDDVEATVRPGDDVEVLAGYVATSAAGALWLELLSEFRDHDPASAAAGTVAPLPGTIRAVAVSPGDVVEEGQVLVVLEAMKMEHRITASSAATVAEVNVVVGDRVDVGDVLVRVEASG